MLPIPHSFAAALHLYASPLTAVLVALLLPLLGRGQSWLPATGAVALFAGWSMLVPPPQWLHAIATPHRGFETLLAPALAGIAAAGYVAWRGTQRPRLLAAGLAVFAGWWLARAGIGAADFWRVWFVVAVLAGLIGRLLGGDAERLLVLALTLWGGLFVAGDPTIWLLAALAATACAAGLVATGVAGAVPAAAVAALLAATDLAGGRLERGRFDTTDLACLAALAAPWVANVAKQRLGLGRTADRLGTLFAGVVGAALTVAAVWVLRRALLT